MKAIIVGGGIGGLATALMLHARGIECDGLRAGGRDPRARRRHQHAAARDRGAGRARPADRRSTRRHPHPRADLHQPLRPGDLARAARPRRRLRGAAVLHPPRPAAGRDPRRRASSGSARTRSAPAAGSAASSRTRAASPPRSSSRFGGARARRSRGDVLVGADGIHSTRARGALSATRARRAGTACMLWRGATDWPAFLDGRTMIIAGGIAAKFVLYPIGRGLAARRAADQLGGHGAHRRRRGAAAAKEDWIRPGRLRGADAASSRRFRSRMSSIAGADPRDAGVLGVSDVRPRSAAALVARPRDAARRCGASDVSGRARTAPSQAILDARCLADASAWPSTRVAALAAYEAERLPKTAEIVREQPQGRAGGRDRRGRGARARRLRPTSTRSLRHAEREAIVRGYASKAGFAREQVKAA